MGSDSGTRRFCYEAWAAQILQRIGGRGERRGGSRETVVCRLRALDLAGEDPGELRKLDVRKQVLAWWVRRQSMVGNRWLAKRLQMGDEGNISKVMRAVSQSRSPDVRRFKKLLMEM